MTSLEKAREVQQKRIDNQKAIVDNLDQELQKQKANLDDERKKMRDIMTAIKKTIEPDPDILDTTIDRHLSARLSGILSQVCIFTLRDLTSMTEHEVRRVTMIGEVYFNEIHTKLAKLGLELKKVKEEKTEK